MNDLKMAIVTPARRAARRVVRRLRMARLIAAAMASKDRPILAQVIPTRRCNLSCTYCNEYDKVSEPVPIDEMLARIDRLAALGALSVDLSGGEPLLHPDLDRVISRIRERGMFATLLDQRLSAVALTHRASESRWPRSSADQHR